MQFKVITFFIFCLLSSYKAICQGQTRCKPTFSSSCGCPWFDVYCENGKASLTLLELPNFANATFMVESIDYEAQEIWLRDPNKCLDTQTLMSLNFSSTILPFKGAHKENRSYFTLLRCRGKKDFVNSDVYTVDCLSNSNYTVVAAPWDYSVVSCDRWGDKDVALSIDPRNDDQASRFLLVWSAPRCRPQGPQLSCIKAGDHGSSSSQTYSKKIIAAIVLAIALGPIAIALVACCIAKILITRRNSSRAATRVVARTTAYREPGTTTTTRTTTTTAAMPGLDQSTIDSFPTVVIGESGRFLKMADQDSCCSICLCDYHPKESLKILPECLHRFHAECIDQWLRAKALCPICRAAPPRT